MDIFLVEKRNIVEYKFEILFLFTFLEVLLYDNLPIIQAIVSIIEYVFVLFCIIVNKRVGIMYLFSFTLLSMGAWSYVTQEELPNNFWGIRLLGFSVNILFCITTSLYLLLISKFKIKFLKQTRAINFYIYFIGYSFFLGLIHVLFFNNYIDNFIKDFLVYLPFLFYLYLFTFLKMENTRLILKYGIILTVLAMAISYVTGKLFEYGGGYSFVLMNAFSFSIIFPIFFFKDLLKKWQLFFLISAILFLLFKGKIFIGSKSFILIFFLIIWTITSSYKVIRYVILFSLLFVLLIGPVINWISLNVDPDLVISYKFNQIVEIFEIVDVDIIAISNTSMGNIVAESLTIYDWICNNFFESLIGKGFGGGLSDSRGYLSTYVGAGAGYNPVDFSRDQFTRLHLPLFEVISKAGLLGTIAYISLLLGVYKEKNIFSFSFFIILLTVFSNSKEMILLSMIFNHIAINFHTNSFRKTHSV